MMNIDLKYIYILFICTQRFYEIYEENKNMFYFKFCEFKIFDLRNCINISY